MSERPSPLEQPRGPVTVAMLISDLRSLGLGEAMTVIVHSSLRSLGWVAGGAQAVVMALLAALGDTGTLVVPTHSSDWSDPAQWVNPPVPTEWWAVIRDHMPAFDSVRTPLRQMGAIPEAVLRLPDARRSEHPWVSFTAVGPQSRAITESHSLEDSLGEGSPLARLYDLEASVLLLGVDHDRNTSLHLAEYRAEWPTKTKVRRGAAMVVDGERRWVDYDDLDIDDRDFLEIASAYRERHRKVREGDVGHARAQLLEQRPMVDFAVGWMAANRGARDPAG